LNGDISVEEQQRAIYIQTTIVYNTIYKSSGWLIMMAFQLSHHQTYSLSTAIQKKTYTCMCGS
jgi:hypothetical protein